MSFKYACKGINALISYGLCYSNDVMHKTYSNYFKNIKKNLKIKNIGRTLRRFLHPIGPLILSIKEKQDMVVHFLQKKRISH